MTRMMTMLLTKKIKRTNFSQRSMRKSMSLVWTHTNALYETMRTTKSRSWRSWKGKQKSARSNKKKKKWLKSKLRGTTGSGLRISGGRLARYQLSFKNSWIKKKSKGRKKKLKEGQSPPMLRLCEKELLRRASGERMPIWRSCDCKV